MAKNLKVFAVLVTLLLGCLFFTGSAPVSAQTALPSATSFPTIIIVQQSSTAEATVTSSGAFPSTLPQSGRTEWIFVAVLIPVILLGLAFLF